MKIYLSPDADGGGGNLGGGVDGGNASGAPDSGNGGSAPAAPQFATREDFQSFQNEVRNSFRQSSPRQERREEAAKSPSKPDHTKYNFQTPGELDRYNDDVFAWQMHGHSERESKKNSEREVHESQKKTFNSHMERIAEYKKSNPDFANDLANAGAVEVTDVVKNAVYRSKSSASIVHYLLKNKDVAEELNLIGDNQGAEGVAERVGEIAYQIRQETSGASRTAMAAGQRPPNQSFRGGMSSSRKSKTNAERYEDFRS